MRELTHKEIEKGAIMELINFFEQQIDTVILQSVLELDKLNEIRKIQGLFPKTRIERICIQRAIKSISQDGFPSLPEKAGGTLSEKGEEHDKRKPETKDLEVEIQ